MKLVRVLSVGLPQRPAEAVHTVESQTLRIESCLNALQAYRPDFVCFPEICVHVGMKLAIAAKCAVQVPSSLTERIGACCKRLNSHVLLPLLEAWEGRVYNTVLLLAPDGSIIGRYRKHFPTSYELADGVSPGDDVQVWETPSARVGAAICFDLKFAEVGLALARGRAQLVFWPSMFNGGARLASWARDYGFHIVSCTDWGGHIVDPRGQSVANTSVQTILPEVGPVHLVHATINADCKSYHLDYNRQKLTTLLERYGPGVQVYFMEDEAIFTLTSLMEDRTVDQIEKEFELEDLIGYLDRARADRAQRNKQIQ